MSEPEPLLVALTSGRHQDLPTRGVDALRTDFVAPGKPLVLDPTRPCLQGRYAVAVLAHEAELRGHPGLVGAALVWEDRTGDPTEYGHQRHPLFLATAVRGADPTHGYTHVLAFSAMRPGAEQPEVTFAALARTATEGAAPMTPLLVLLPSPFVCDIGCVSDDQARFVLMALVTAATTGRLRMPTGRREAERTRSAGLAVAQGALGEWHLDTGKIGTGKFPPTRTMVIPLPDEHRAW